MNKDLKRIFITDIAFKLITGFLLFVNLKVWERTESLQMMFYYYFAYFVFRFISYGLGTYFVLKSRILFLLRTSFLLIIFQFLSFLVVLDYIENDWIWVAMVAFPTGFFASFYKMSSNQLISHYGKKKEYPTFFSYRTFVGTVIGFFIPLLFGLLIEEWGFKISCFIFIIIGSLCFAFTLKLKKADITFPEKTNFLHDVMYRDKGVKIAPQILTFHTLLVLIGGFAFQFVDVFKSIFTFISADNAFYLGVLNAIFLAVSSIGLLLFKRLPNVSKFTWFVVSSITLGVAIICSTILTVDKTNLIFICMLFAFGLYFFITLYESLSFELIGKQSDYHKFVVLFKREMISMVGKISFTIISFIFAFESFSDAAYKWLSYATILILIITMYLYKRIAKTIEEQE